MGVVSRSASAPNVAGKLCKTATKAAASTDIPRVVSTWQEQLRHLNLQAWSAESDSRRELQASRVLTREEAQEMRSSLQAADDCRKAWEHQLWRDVAKVRKRVCALAYNVQFVAVKDEVQSLVRNAEHQLHALREQARQQDEDLSITEISLDDGLQASLARFEGWCAQESALARPSVASHSVSTRTPSCSRIGSKNGQKTSKEPAEISAIRDQLDRLTAQIDATGGATGGWPNDDHDAFQRIMVKYNRRPSAAFLTDLQQVLPHLTHEALIAHISWQAANEERVLAKRQLLERWRSLKAEANLRNQSELEFTEEQAREERQQKDVSRKREQKDLEARRRQVVQWRQARDDALRSEEDEQSRQAQLAREREDVERQRRTEEVREKVEAFRLQRLAHEELAQRASDAAQQRPSKKVQQRIAHRSAELLQRRSSQVQAKKTQLCGNRFEPPERLATKYSNVESRLEVHTEAYVEKSREGRDESNKTGSASRGIPGNFAHQGIVRTLRSSPSWRPQFGV